MKAMKSLSLSLAVLLIFIQPSQSAEGTPARVLAEEAFEQIYDNIFRTPVLRDAAKKIRRARGLDPKEPYVYLAASALAMARGYISGDRYKKSNYTKGTINNAMKLAGKAVNLDPNLVKARTELASIYIIQKLYKEAIRELKYALQINNRDFSAYYHRAVLYVKQGRPEDARELLEKLLPLADKKRHRIVIYSRLADLTKNPAEEEKFLKKIIEIGPETSQHYGNYANFLKRQRRYDEAIKVYEKALAISPYPLAKKQLAETRRLKKRQ